MKTKLILLTIVFLGITFYGQTNPTQTTNAPKQNVNLNIKKESKTRSQEKEKEYKVVKSSPTLKYRVRKLGEGNRVLFSVNYGKTNLPNQMQITTSSGSKFSEGKKQGVEYAEYPLKCTLFCPGNSEVNPMNNMAQKINDFEIEIKEPGTWEITFTR